MTAPRRLLLLLLAALFFGVAQPGVARAEDGGEGRSGDNAAVAINTKDGSSLFRLAFSIRRVAGEVVDNQNIAFAYASCESCRTTAIAIQIVLVEGSPSTVTPVNVAVALNENCTLCQTFASAYQFVVGTNGPVRFTAAGRRELAQIRKALRDLRKEDLTPAELDARVKALMERVRRVLAQELVPIARGSGDGEDDDAGEDEEFDEGEPDEPDTTSTAETETETGETETTETETTSTETGETETTTTP
jgi:putative peptide zinc metalloprotease protein